MKLFDPENPFIKSVNSTLGLLGTSPQPVYRTKIGESLLLSYTPELANGRLYHNSDLDCWEQRNLVEDSDKFVMCFESNGLSYIRKDDTEAAVYLKTTLRAGDELPELLDFFETAKANKIGSSAITRRSLKTLLEGVYLLIPSAPQTDVFSLGKMGVTKMHPEVTRILDAFFVGDAAEEMFEVGNLDLWEYLDECELKDNLPAPESLQEGDLVLDIHGNLIYAGIYRQNTHSTGDSSPTLVLRPRSDVSRMWLIDYLECAAESGGLLEGITKNWRNLAQWLGTVEISLPLKKRDQIASSVLRRLYRHLYLDRIQALTTLREPFGKIQRLYKKRLHAAYVLHTELLDDIEAIQHPLPFFLEYPYRHFRKEDDHLQKVRAGQRLLGILAKIPLFLVVEELLSAGHELGSMILEKLEERAPSDGTLVALQKLTAEELAKLPASPLAIFQNLQPLLADTTDLEAMVTARNRMHHEPYDEIGFLTTMEERASRVVETLRTALQVCRFIVPHHGKVLDGDKLVTAEDVCNADAHFRTVDLKVTLPLEQFHSGDLMVLKSSPELTLKLGKLLTSKLVTQQSRDFGIFDRMQKNERHFTFLRSD